MAIVIKYVVEHNGEEKLVTCDKKAADQYDKMLDTADELVAFLKAQEIDVSEKALEDIGVAFAKNKDEIIGLLKGKAFVATPKADPSQA